MKTPQSEASLQGQGFSGAGLLAYARANRERLTRLVMISLCLFGMLSGKSDLSRVEVFSAIMPGVEIRLICLLALAAVAVFWRLDEKSPSLSEIGIWPVVVSLPWLAMLAYGVIGARLLWPVADYGPYLADLFYMIVYIFTLAVVVRTKQDLTFLAIFLQIFALLVFIVSLLRLGPDSRAYNYGEVVTTTTMYRIYGSGFCAALFLLFSSNDRWMKLAQFVLAIVLTFAMLSSTSKTSVVAIIAIIAIIGLFASIFARWKDLAILAVIIALGVGIFFNGGSPHLLTDRLVDFGQSTLTETRTTDGIVQPRDYFPEIPPASACNPDEVVLLGDNVALRSYSCIPIVVVPDPSERLRMLTYALELFGQNNMYGVGPLGYNLALGDGHDMFVYTYAHNIFADALAKTGFVGVALLLVALFGLLVVCIRAVARQFESLYITCIPLLYIAGSVTGGDLYDTRVGWAIAAAVGTVYGWRALSADRAE